MRESTKQLRRMLAAGRFHAYAASFRFERGRWHVTITGVAAPLHHARRNPRAAARIQQRVGVDVGVKTLITAADENGRVLAQVEGVKALQHAQLRLRAANKVYSRTKIGSNGRARAARRLGRLHARVANLRATLLHQITSELAKRCSTVVVEDLNVAGMVANRRLARHVSDAAFGELRRQLAYKTVWYDTELVIADRWYPSSKTCSACGAVNSELTLSDRVYACACGLVLDRDVNAAVNLARWTPPAHDLPLPAAA